MNVLFDTNVVLDVLLDREPFASPAVCLFEQVERGELSGALCATTLTTVHYLVAKSLGKEMAREAVAKLLQLFEVASVTRAVLETGLRTDMDDFEDAVLHQSACLFGCEGIVTRNGRDFKRAEISIFTPEELISTLSLRFEKG